MVPVLLVTKQKKRLGQLPGLVRGDFWHPGNCVSEAKPSGGLFWGVEGAKLRKPQGSEDG